MARHTCPRDPHVRSLPAVAVQFVNGVAYCLNIEIPGTAKKSMLKEWLFGGLLLATAITAHAESVTARVVADDHYKIFVGDASGTSLVEVASSGSSLWPSQGAPVVFGIGAGQYLYVAAWDSASYGPPHAWIGEFDIAGTKLYSNTTDWVGKANGTIKNPSAGDAAALASSPDAWSTLMASMANGSSPYGTLIGNSPASFVWTDTFGGNSASEGGYALFRTLNAVVMPLPGALPLLLSGMGLVMLRARSRR